MAAVQHEFAPPAPRGILSALVLALLAHALLALVLSVGVQWRRSAPVVAAEAELWAAVPQVAAPATEPEPEPEPPTAPLPPLPVPVETPKLTPPAPDIVLEKEKQRQRQAELDKALREKERLAQLEQDKREKERLEKEKQTKLAQDKARTDKDKQAKLDAAKKAKEEEQLHDKLRQEQLKRLAGLASGGTGEAKSTGSAAQSAGPSAGYAGRIVARVRPNIVFTENVSGKPLVRVEVHTAPDGTILMSRTRILQGSGVRGWDEAVLKALEKTEILPKNEDGRIPSPMEITFRPKD